MTTSFSSIFRGKSQKKNRVYWIEILVLQSKDDFLFYFDSRLISNCTILSIHHYLNYILNQLK